MKKTTLIFVLLALVVSLGMSYTIGICGQNWCGFVGCSKYHGVYVSKTVEGYVADGILMKGDVITEALVFPACNCCGNCCAVECCKPCNPCNPCNPCDPCVSSSKAYTFTPRCTLHSQLSQFGCESYCYKKTWNKFALADVLDVLCPGGTVVMRVYRTCTCQWMIAVLTRDAAGSPTLKLFKEPCPQSATTVEVIVTDPVCEPGMTIQVIVNN